MARQARAACAEREAQRNFLLPHRRARQQQVGDVRARDQQNERDRAEENEQGRFDVADELLVQRPHPDPDARVVLRILLFQPRGDRRHLGLRLLPRHAGLRARDHLQVMISAARGFLRGKGDRHPELVVPVIHAGQVRPLRGITPTTV